MCYYCTRIFLIFSISVILRVGLKYSCELFDSTWKSLSTFFTFSSQYYNFLKFLASLVLLSYNHFLLTDEGGKNFVLHKFEISSGPPFKRYEQICKPSLLLFIWSSIEYNYFSRSLTLPKDVTQKLTNGEFKNEFYDFKMRSYKESTLNFASNMYWNCLLPRPTLWCLINIPPY